MTNDTTDTTTTTMSVWMRLGLTLFITAGTAAGGLLPEPLRMLTAFAWLPLVCAVWSAK